MTMPFERSAQSFGCRVVARGFKRFQLPAQRKQLRKIRVRVEEPDLPAIELILCHVLPPQIAHFPWLPTWQTSYPGLDYGAQ